MSGSNELKHERLRTIPGIVCILDTPVSSNGSSNGGGDGDGGSGSGGGDSYGSGGDGSESGHM